MTKLIKQVFTFAILLALGFGTAMAQDNSISALQKDYPLLTKRYGDKLQSRTAHYIFAIDISSSMKAYETVVKESLQKFVDAVPNGDQITLIVMSDENNTNYLELTKCVTLNDKLRQTIKNTVASSSFSFLRNGDPRDGSDGFTMAKKVLESMNVVGSSELTFAYLLTDFEYWTHKNRYDKNKEDWNSLKPMLTEKHTGMMCKYGIELTMNKVQHPEAIFKSELDNIFGPLEYQQVSTADMLAQWFGHIINDIRAHKINAMLKADWKEYLDNCNVTFHNDGLQLKADVEAPECDLVNGCRIVLNQHGAQTLKTCDTASCERNENIWSATAGNYVKDKTYFASFIEEDASDVEYTVLFDSPYAKEIATLQELCQENELSPDAVRLSKNGTETLPEMRIWNAKWHWICHILIILALAGLLAALIYMLCIHPDKRYTAIIVKRQGNGATKQFNGETNRLPITVGNGGDVNVTGATWTLKIYSRNRYPICSWLSKKKTGYYAKLEEGDFAEVINEFTDSKIATVSRGKSVFLFKYKKAPNVRIEITEGTTTNKIEIS